MSTPYREPAVVKPSTVEVSTDDVVVRIYYLDPYGAITTAQHEFKGEPSAFWSETRQVMDTDTNRGSFACYHWLVRIGEKQLVEFGDEVIPVHRLLQIKKLSVTEKTVIVDVEY